MNLELFIRITTAVKLHRMDAMDSWVCGLLANENAQVIRECNDALLYAKVEYERWLRHGEVAA